uniref:Spermatogenesis-associated protein 6 N-terminal domain-containing protein n=2 Tax=Clastoptera arizonana TaxID=38151 RepID=A0A1B6CXN0_9HEMI
MSKSCVQSKKAYNVTINFDIHAVTCPGVWLCSKGMVMLKITLFGQTKFTKGIKPIFPLLFHERFHFHKVFSDINTLCDLTKAFKHVNIELIQIHENNSRRTLLATFKRLMAEVLNPVTSDKSLIVGVDVDLLMEASDCFPGVLVPKVEISTTMVIEEINCPAYKSWVINPVTVTTCKKQGSKLEKKHKQISPMRQKRVCHRRQKPKCKCLEPLSKWKVKEYPLQSNHDEINCEGYNNTICQCCQHCKEADLKYLNKISKKKQAKEGNKFNNELDCKTHQFTKSHCNCQLCENYNHIFSCSCGFTQDRRKMSTFLCSKDDQFSETKVNGCCSSFEKSPAQLRCPFLSKMDSCSCEETCHRKSFLSDKEINPWISGDIKEDLRKLYPTFSYPDTEDHYKKLYERICKKNNQEDNHVLNKFIKD